MTRQERLRLEFEERVERQRDEQRARSSAGSQRRDEHDESTTPAPRGEWLQRSGTSFLRTSPGEVTGRDQSYDDYIVKKYGPTPAREVVCKEPWTVFVIVSLANEMIVSR